MGWRNPRPASRRSSVRRNRLSALCPQRLRIEELEERRVLAVGAVDTSFGTSGITQGPATSFYHVHSVATLADGRILEAGTANDAAGNSAYTVLRYNVNGTLDTTFGVGGRATISVTPATSFAQINSMVVTPANQILIAGTDGSNFTIARLNFNGSLDTTFGTGGVTAIKLNGSALAIEAIGVQSSGQIVAMGHILGNGWEVFRFNADGSRDNTFAGTGLATVPFAATLSPNARGIDIQTDDKIVVVGSVNNTTWAIARYNADGSLDTGFGTGGATTTDFAFGSSQTAINVKQQLDGSLVVVGTQDTLLATARGFETARYTSAGVLDPTFGSGGIVVTAFPNGTGGFANTRASDLAIQQNGRIVVGGIGNYSQVPGEVLVARYNFNGTLDTTFGNAGLTRTRLNNLGTFFGASNEQSGLALEPDGNIVVGFTGDVFGSQAGAGLSNFQLARFIGDPVVPTLNIANVSQLEGNSGVTNFVFTFTLTAVSASTITVNYATASGTATSGVDFLPAAGTVTIPAGSLSGTFTVGVLGDTTIENDETFTVNFNTPVNAALGRLSVIGTIRNDDVLTVSGADVAQAEGDSGTTPFVFAVTVNAGALVPVTVRYTTVDGSATAGSDYTSTSGTLTFPVGTTTQLVTVLVNGDTTIEPNETFLLQLSNATGGAVLARTQLLGTILDDDGPKTVSINDVSLNEGDDGQTSFVFAVTMSGPLGKTATVDYATANGTATAGSDYVATTGTVTFLPGQMVQLVTVLVNGDTDYEPTETFTVSLSNATPPTSLSLGPKSVGVGTIVNDDPFTLPGALYVSNAGITLQPNSAATLDFTVALVSPNRQRILVDYSTADGTATDGTDYTGVTGTLIFAPGVTQQTISIPVQSNDVDIIRTFALNLGNAVNAVIYVGQGTGYITTDSKETATIVDDGDPGYSQAGNWTKTLSTVAVGLDNRITSGTGNDHATWDVGVNPGQYQVYVHYSSYMAWASNAPFTIKDSSVTRGTVAVNQRVAPADLFADGTWWKSLGTYDVASGDLNVTLTDAANGFVVADAIRVVSRGALVSQPKFGLGSLGVLISAGDSTPQALDGTSFGSATATSGSVVHTFTIHNTGNGTLTLTGTPLIKFTGANPGDFSVLSAPATSIAPGGSSAFQILFSPTAAGTRTAFVSIASNDLFNTPFMFEVQGTGITPTVPQVIDDGDAGYTKAGNWVSTPNTLSFGNDYSYDAPGSGADRATWSFGGLTTGTYQVFTHYVPFASWATNAPFSIYDGTALKQTVLVNERVAATDSTYGGLSYKSLGTFTVNSGNLKVMLTNNANGYVVADDIRIVQVASPAVAPTVAIASPTVGPAVTPAVIATPVTPAIVASPVASPAPVYQTVTAASLVSPSKLTARSLIFASNATLDDLLTPVGH